MAAIGWLKLNRGITENWLWPKGKKYTELEAWLWMLINANFSDSKVYDEGKLITVKRGQLLTSQLKMSKTFLWSREKVRNFSEILKTDGMIDVKPYTKFTIITICKYEDYQSDRTTEPQQTVQQTDRRPDNRPDTSEEGKEGEERKEDEKRQRLFEMLKRATTGFADFILYEEVGKFINRYPDIEPNKAAALINTWAGNIKRDPVIKLGGIENFI